MRDVGEGAAVHDGRGVVDGLHQVGLDGVLQQQGHGTGGLQLFGGDGVEVAVVGGDHAGQAGLQVVHAGGETQDGHHLAGHGDVEAALAGHAVGTLAQPDDDVAQGAVVHVEHPTQFHALGVDAQGVALVQGVVEQGTQQVVGGPDRLHVAGELQVEVVHRQHLA